MGYSCPCCAIFYPYCQRTIIQTYTWDALRGTVLPSETGVPSDEASGGTDYPLELLDPEQVHESDRIIGTCVGFITYGEACEIVYRDSGEIAAGDGKDAADPNE